MPSSKPKSLSYSSPHDIHDDDVIVVEFDETDGTHAVFGFRDFEPVELRVFTNDLTDLRFVVDYKYLIHKNLRLADPQIMFVVHTEYTRIHNYFITNGAK